jgi:hypothetical protein
MCEHNGKVMIVHYVHISNILYLFLVIHVVVSGSIKFL